MNNSTKDKKMNKYGTTHETKYGFTKIIGHRRIDRTGCVQITEWTAKRTGEKVTESIHCVDSRDFSTHDGIKYEADCYFCYAGIGHTIELHNKSIKKAA